MLGEVLLIDSRLDNLRDLLETVLCSEDVYGFKKLAPLSVEYSKPASESILFLFGIKILFPTKNAPPELSITLLYRLSVSLSVHVSINVMLPLVPVFCCFT